jgi:hypothetical protein
VRPYLKKITKAKKAQVVECLPSKCEILSEKRRIRIGQISHRITNNWHLIPLNDLPPPKKDTRETPEPSKESVAFSSQWCANVGSSAEAKAPVL